MQIEIDLQLQKIITDLEDAFAHGQVNVFLLRAASGIAGLLNRSDLAARLAPALSGVTMGDCLRGAITNIVLRDEAATQPMKLESLEQVARQHPPSDDRFLTNYMVAQGGLHVRLCLQGDIDGAVRAAVDDLELEDIGCALAVNGQLEDATAFTEAQCTDGVRKAHIRFVVLLEKCRRGHWDYKRAIDDTKLGPYERLSVVLALARRLPWLGYPFSDW